MSATIIPFKVPPDREGLECLKASMRRHSKSGLCPADFDRAVRADCPGATLEQLDAAAAVVWKELAPPDHPDDAA